MTTLMSDQDSWLAERLSCSFPLTEFLTEGGLGHSSNGIDGKFLRSQVLISVLLRMKPSAIDKDEFVQLCKNNLINPADLRTLDEFDRTYVPNDAIEWYTKGTFICRLLNKALRSHEPELLISFAFYLRDIHSLLDQQQKKLPTKVIHVYRGQFIAWNEFAVLISSTGKLFSMNSFLSTSLNQDVAKMFLGDSTSSELTPVFFDIEVDPSVISTIPFGDISELSTMRDEKEVLFGIGKLFQVVGTDRKDGLNIILLRVSNDENHELKELMVEERKDLDVVTDRMLLPYILTKSGKLDLAEKYIQRRLDELLDHELMGKAMCYSAKGNVMCERRKYKESLIFYKKAMVVYEDNLPVSYSLLAHVYTAIGLAYKQIGNLETAREFITKALTIYEDQYGKTHQFVGDCLSNIADILCLERKFNDAIAAFLQSLAIQKKHLPDSHLHIAITHNNIGLTYFGMKRFKRALEHVKIAHGMKLKSLQPLHVEIARSHKNLGIIHLSMKNCRESLLSYEEAAVIFQTNFHENHPEMIDIKKKVNDIKLLLSFFR